MVPALISAHTKPVVLTPEPPPWLLYYLSLGQVGGFCSFVSYGQEESRTGFRQMLSGLCRHFFLHRSTNISPIYQFFVLREGWCVSSEGNTDCSYRVLHTQIPRQEKLTLQRWKWPWALELCSELRSEEEPVTFHPSLDPSGLRSPLSRF